MWRGSKRIYPSVNLVAVVDRRNRRPIAKLDCAISILREGFLSVRDYGLRTDEPRQGRNAATVV
jgi:hypothetical protein